MKMKMPFDGFYLKLLDEQNGTHEYEEYLRNCKENPLTEEEQREWTESARAAIAELERINAEPEPTRQAAEAEGTSRPQTPEPTELQEGCCTGQEAEDAPEVEVTVAKETSIPQGEGALLLPEEPTVIPEMASEPKRIRITELVKENFKNWRDGTRIVFDAGVNSGKTYFILNVLLPWAYQKHWKIIYLCNRVPLRNEIQQEVERLGRTEEKVGRWDHDLQQIVYETRVTNKYKDTIRVETYQWMESFCKGNPKGTMNYFKSFNYIVADEYHYLLTDLHDEIAKRKNVVERYRERLSGVEGIKLSAVQENVESNYAYFPVVFDGYKYTRNEVYEMLSEQGITARKYFYPLTNSFECYRNYPTAGVEKTPVAQHLALRVLTLPLYADLALEDVDRICDIILA